MRTSFTGHAAEFAGLPVFGLGYDPGDEPPRLLRQAELPADPGSAAWRAEPGKQYGHRYVAVDE